MNTDKTPSVVREEVADLALTSAYDALRSKLLYRLDQKGRGTFASRHEALGIVTEEYHELVEAVRSGSIQDVRSELLDIAVGCMFAIAGIDGKHIQW